VVVTTPNVEFNPLYGLGPGERRDPEHRFEWSRDRFRGWSHGVARRHGYRVRFQDIGELDPDRGSPTQMAVFSAAAAPESGSRESSR
jgi:small RNA 2'-O-methyltransferase